MSNIAINYFSEGLIANRPTAPLVAAGATAFYWATDTLHMYVWSAAGAWKLIK